MQNWLEIGKIVRAHGIKGAVKIISYLDGVSFSIFKKVYIGTNKLEAEIINCAPLNGGAFSIILNTIKNVDQTQKYINETVFIDRNMYPTFKEKVYLSDLIDTDILDEFGNSIGTLVDVNEYGASTILEIKCDAVTYSLPFVEDYINYDENKKALVTTRQVFEDMKV